MRWCIATLLFISPGAFADVSPPRPSGEVWLKQCREVFVAAGKKLAQTLPEIADLQVIASFTREPRFIVNLSLHLELNPAETWHRGGWHKHFFEAEVFYGNPAEFTLSPPVEVAWHDYTTSTWRYSEKQKQVVHRTVMRQRRAKWNLGRVSADGPDFSALQKFQRAMEPAVDECFALGKKLGPPPVAREVTKPTPENASPAPNDAPPTL